MSEPVYEISVKTAPVYLEEQSDPTSDRYSFAYTITLTNTGDIAARLITRHWHITDANGKEQEVHGMGVVGEQPYLAPGESYEYSSGVVLDTPVGSMHGSYRFLADDDEEFEAPIAPFTLSIPNALH